MLSNLFSSHGTSVCFGGPQPCYHLPKLHSAIQHDLPPTPNGFVEVWSVITDILREQRK